MLSEYDRIIRLKKVMEMTGLSRSTIYRMMDKGEFPVSTSLGERAIGWSLHEVREWQQKRLDVRNSFTGVDYASEAV